STSLRIWRARRTPASVSAYTRTFRVRPRSRVSRGSRSPSDWRAFNVRGTWLRSRRAPSAIPAWVPSRPSSWTFQNGWRWRRTRVSVCYTISTWVGSITARVAQTRVAVDSKMVPLYNGLGVEIAVNMTLTHPGGEALGPVSTIIYVTSQRGTNPAKTDIQRLHPYNRLLATPNGLLDGTDSTWNVGERWGYKNFTLLSSDVISVTLVDTSKSVVLWSATLTPPAGTRPPVFLDKWTDGLYSSTAVDPVESGLGFFVFAHVVDPDNDLNPKSVYARLTAWYGTGDPCSQPQQMRDDGLYPDRVPGDGIFSLVGLTCLQS